MIILTGASASGKTEVAKLLASKYGICKVITTTTRPIRVNEVDGRDYFFKTIDEFKALIKQGHFVEYTLYNSNYYGSSKDQVKDDKCIVIDPVGLESYKNLNNPTIVTFYLSASEQIRFNRMIARGDKEIDAKKRIQKDKDVFDINKIKVDYYIDSESHTVEEVCDEIYRIYQTKIPR